MVLFNLKEDILPLRKQLYKLISQTSSDKDNIVLDILHVNINKYKLNTKKIGSFF